MEPITETMPQKPKLILFDVYETLLDMEMIEKRVNDILNSKRGYVYWFELFMQYCFVENSLGTFNHFTAIAQATLQMAGRTLGSPVSERQVDAVIELLQHLPLKEGINSSLSELYDEGYRIAALTNAPRSIIINRMERSGLISYFEMVFSAEEIRKYKPEKEVYLWAANKLGLQPAEILFVSSHSWDIAGAANAGFQTVFLNQFKQLYYPLSSPPTLTLKNLLEMKEQLKTVYQY